MNEFANLFSSKRIEKGLSQGEIASMLNVTRQAVSKWENGKAMPDITLMPQIAEILGVSIEELLTGNEPKKQVEVVEKIVVQEKEIIKPMPVRKILAIVLPIVLVVVLASSLMGVYIPRAIARNTPPPVTETPEPEIQYTEVLIKGKSDTDDSRFQAPLINNKAYYGLKMQFSSDYTLYITAPKGAVVTFNTSEADYTVPDGIKTTSTVIAEFDTAKTVEYSLFFKSEYFYNDNRFGEDKYTTGSCSLKWDTIETVGDPEVLGSLANKIVTHYYKYIVIDVTNCSEEDRVMVKQQIVVRQHMGFDNVTVPANSSYFTAIPRSENFDVKHYEIKSTGVQFVDTRILMQVHDYSSLYAGMQHNSHTVPISDFYILNYAGIDVDGGGNCDWYVGFINETNEDICLEIEEAPIEEINLFQTVEVKANGIKDYKRIYKLNLGNNRPELMYKMKGVEDMSGTSIGYFDENMSPFFNWSWGVGYESEWNDIVFRANRDASSSECYIIVKYYKDKDFCFAFDSWGRYEANRPAN